LDVAGQRLTVAALGQRVGLQALDGDALLGDAVLVADEGFRLAERRSLRTLYVLTVLSSPISRFAMIVCSRNSSAGVASSSTMPFGASAPVRDVQVPLRVFGQGGHEKYGTATAVAAPTRTGGGQRYRA